MRIEFNAGAHCIIARILFNITIVVKPVFTLRIKGN